MSYAVLAFYHLTHLEDPHREVLDWKQALTEFQARGRIYISCEGINAQMSLSSDKLDAFTNWLHSQKSFTGVQIKASPWHEHAFEKLIIKYRQQLVAFDQKVDTSQRAQHITPSKWREILGENDPQTIVLDVRNQYEYELGHFEGAKAPECNRFRDYAGFADRLANECDPKNTRVLMYCTGGIRCEFFSPYLKERGFDQVLQLEGGVIQYGICEGNDHWKGKLFVFDDRMTVPISEQPSDSIACCRHCSEKCDDLYNCANTDCNEMFVSCNACTQKLLGCCCNECTQSPRLRPLEHQNPHRPFRKWHQYANQEKSK